MCRRGLQWFQPCPSANQNWTRSGADQFQVIIFGGSIIIMVVSYEDADPGEDATAGFDDTAVNQSETTPEATAENLS